MYRNVQVLSTLWNKVQQNLLGAFIVGATLDVASSLALLSKGVKEKSFNNLTIGALGLTAIEGIAGLLLMLETPISINRESKKLLANVKQYQYMKVGIPGMKSKWGKLFWKSCAALRIKFGENNFLEEATSIRCLDWANDLTVQILLLSRGK